MSEPDATRRFDEREFALILRRAATLQQSDAARPPRSGLSLAEVESIAAEAGIDSVYVRQAAAALSSDAPTIGRRLIGARPASSSSARCPRRSIAKPWPRSSTSPAPNSAATA